jgi:ubiquinone/menaquinone biosynthesis C-methylase UbiE
MAEKTIFDYQAKAGLTKHIGGVQASRRLAELCHIDAGDHVLEIGCGVGQTPCMLARELGCQILGVDLRPEMVKHSQARAQREGLTDRVEFRVADLRQLPYEDGHFDVVFAESVISFPSDKQKAINECVRVLRPGGYLGINESTWLKTPVPEQYTAWVAQDLGDQATILDKQGWVALLETAGLVNIHAETNALDLKQEARATFERYGLKHMLRIFALILKYNLTDPEYRKAVRKASSQAPKGLLAYFGYGLYVGQKAGG